MSKSFLVLGVADIYQDEKKKVTKNNLELQRLLWGMFQLDKIVCLRSALERKDSQIKQMEWVAYFNVTQKVPKASRFQNRLMERFVTKD